MSTETYKSTASLWVSVKVEKGNISLLYSQKIWVNSDILTIQF